MPPPPPHPPRSEEPLSPADFRAAVEGLNLVNHNLVATIARLDLLIVSIETLNSRLGSKAEREAGGALGALLRELRS